MGFFVSKKERKKSRTKQKITPAFCSKDWSSFCKEPFFSDNNFAWLLEFFNCAQKRKKKIIDKKQCGNKKSPGRIHVF